MNRKQIYIYILLMCFACVTGCGNESRVNSKPIAIERIDLLVENYTPSTADSLEPGVDIYVKLMGLGAIDRDSAMTMLRESPVSRIFGRDIKARFTQTDSLAGPLGNTVARLGETLPDINVSHVYGIASPYMQGVIVSDSVVIVALNHYLGSDYEGYASMPAYSRRLKTPSRIPADVAEALIRVNYPYQSTDGTLLERLLYEGAVINTAMQANGDTPPAALGLSDDEYRAVKDATAELWNALAAERLLYSTAPADIARLVEPAPFSTIGSIQLPGRACRIIGLDIIRSYISEHPDVTAGELLSPDFYGRSQNVLIDSRYNP